MLVSAQSGVMLKAKIWVLNFHPAPGINMKTALTLRSCISFVASAVLMLFLFASGASALAGWMPDSEGLPVDIAAVAR